MRALTWHGKEDVRIETVPDPKIMNRQDAIVKITSTAICGSDLHIYDGFIPGMEAGDILGHEFMGEVVEVGPDVKKLRKGDRVVVPFPISCGRCFHCSGLRFSNCENSNPNAYLAEKMWGHSPAGLFGYSHLLGGFAGGQAEYARVPFADVGPLKIPDHLDDEKVLFLTDILPTGWMGAENANIQEGDTVAVWGCGPVGLFTILSAKLMGAERVIAIDRHPERLRIAHEQAGADVVLDYERTDVMEALKSLTGGRGPDACIDSVGMEAHMPDAVGAYDRMKTILMQQTDRPGVLRQAILSVRNGGTVSVNGVYGGFIDKFPMGAVVNRALTIRSGQTHVQKYLPMLLEKIEKGEIDPSFIISHRLELADAPGAYKMFRDQRDECIKVVLKPHEQLH